MIDYDGKLSSRALLIYPAKMSSATSSKVYTATPRHVSWHFVPIRGIRSKRRSIIQSVSVGLQPVLGQSGECQVSNEMQSRIGRAHIWVTFGPARMDIYATARQRLQLLLQSSHPNFMHVIIAFISGICFAFVISFDRRL